MSTPTEMPHRPTTPQGPKTAYVLEIAKWPVNSALHIQAPREHSGDAVESVSEVGYYR